MRRIGWIGVLVGLAGLDAAVAQEADRGCAVPAEAAARSCDLEEILDQNRTLEQIAAFWGPALVDGPNGEMKLYRFPSNERLWLSFAADGRLVRAILLSNAAVPTTRVLLNELPATRSRRRDQLDFAAPLTARDVAAAWGPPDNLVGSGIDHWVYTLADGETVKLVFDGERVVGAGPPGVASRPRLDHGGDVIRFNNSYAYAANHLSRERTAKPQPGDRTGRSLLADPRSRGSTPGGFRIDVLALLEAIERDGQMIYLGTTPQDTHSAPAGTYIAALLVDDAGPVQDYHFYRRDSGGSWSGKTYLAANRDASGNVVLDPRAADADFGTVGTDRLNFSRFVGFLAVRPGAAVGREAGASSEPPRK
jgi:hypothetical protein